MFETFEEYYGGVRVYVAVCKKCGEKIVERRARDLKRAIKLHECRNL